MKVAACLVALLAMQQADSCNTSPAPAPKEALLPPIHRFESVSGVGQTGLALDTVTGQWCRTWDWSYKAQSLNGTLDTLPTCLSLFNSYQAK